MAINGEDGVSAVTVDELLKQGLRIPNYQRPYSWEVSTALQLVDDLSEALRETERKDIPYVLGAIILHDDGEYLNVVDGQQRLLTLRMICNFAFFSGLIGAQFWAERAQPKSPELDAKLLVSC